MLFWCSGVASLWTLSIEHLQQDMDLPGTSYRLSPYDFLENIGIDIPKKEKERHEQCEKRRKVSAVYERLCELLQACRHESTSQRNR